MHILLPIFIFLFPTLLLASETTSRGPIKISADETISKEKGQFIEAKGNVHISYELESEDQLESFSNFARFNQTDSTGELMENPKAIWKRKDPREPTITLTANRILLDIQKEKLTAQGNAVVIQAESELKARQIIFSNREKRLDAAGDRPEFFVNAPDQKTRISAEGMTAFTDKKIIYFNEKVHGVITPLEKTQ